jgi:hypothetical protein
MARNFSGRSFRKIAAAVGLGMNAVLQNGLASLGKRTILAARKIGWLRRFCGVPILALFLTLAPAHAKPRVVELPYRSVDSYILVDVKIDGSPVRLLVDTGANRTIVNAKSFCRTELNVTRPVNRGPGIVGGALRLRVDLELTRQVKLSQPVSVMDLEELSKSFRIQFDGLLGQDVLNKFRSVRIDYKRQVIELEE